MRRASVSGRYASYGARSMSRTVIAAMPLRLTTRRSSPRPCAGPWVPCGTPQRDVHRHSFASAGRNPHANRSPDPRVAALPADGRRRKRRPITFETFLNGALSGYLTPCRNEFARVLGGARVCDRDRISGTTGQPECAPGGNLKNETWRICRARAGQIGKPLNANGKGICASRTPRYRAARHVSALKHEWRAGVARGWPSRMKNPTASWYSGRLAAWHRRCVLSSGLVRSAKPFLVTSGGFHA